MRRYLLPLILVASGILLLETTCFSAGGWACYPGFPEVRKSNAYHKFSNREANDFSKLLYLIDRFADSEIVILYDGHPYSPRFAAPLARLFLARNYRKQKPEEWIMRWCNTSVFSGELIFVKLPDGKMQPAREILVGELKDLEKVLAEDQKIEEKSAEVGAISPSEPAAKA